jgi:hypothetical protein
MTKDGQNNRHRQKIIYDKSMDILHLLLRKRMVERSRTLSNPINYCGRRFVVGRYPTIVLYSTNADLPLTFETKTFFGGGFLVVVVVVVVVDCLCVCPGSHCGSSSSPSTTGQELDLVVVTTVYCPGNTCHYCGE